jgi:hypothetical protein
MTMRQYMARFVSMLLFLLINNPVNSFGQTLEQTVGYIFSGGFVDLGDIKQVGQDTVRIPGYWFLPTLLMPPVTLTVTNRKQCMVKIEGFQYNQHTYLDLYLNNVILSETHHETNAMFPAFSKFY